MGTETGGKMSAPVALWAGSSQIMGAHRVTLRWRGAVISLPFAEDKRLHLGVAKVLS